MCGQEFETKLDCKKLKISKRETELSIQNREYIDKYILKSSKIVQ